MHLHLRVSLVKGSVFLADGSDQKRKRETPDEGFPSKQSPGLFFHPFLRFERQKSPALCEEQPKALPLETANL
jgi:hypothetical protein